MHGCGLQWEQGSGREPGRLNWAQTMHHLDTPTSAARSAVHSMLQLPVRMALCVSTVGATGTGSYAQPGRTAQLALQSRGAGLQQCWNACARLLRRQTDTNQT